MDSEPGLRPGFGQGCQTVAGEEPSAPLLVSAIKKQECSDSASASTGLRHGPGPERDTPSRNVALLHKPSRVSKRISWQASRPPVGVCWVAYLQLLLELSELLLQGWVDHGHCDLLSVRAITILGLLTTVPRDAIGKDAAVAEENPNAREVCRGVAGLLPDSSSKTKVSDVVRSSEDTGGSSTWRIGMAGDAALQISVAVVVLPVCTVYSWEKPRLLTSCR